MTTLLVQVELAISDLIKARSRLGQINHVEAAIERLQAVRGRLLIVYGIKSELERGEGPTVAVVGASSVYLRLFQVSEGQRLDALAALKRIIAKEGELSSDLPLVIATIGGVDLDAETVGKPGKQ